MCDAPLHVKLLFLLLVFGQPFLRWECHLDLGPRQQMVLGPDGP